MDQCYNSWFGRHRDTQKQTSVSNQMRAGTKNELPTIEKLRSEEIVEGIFDVGLLQYKFCPFLGVSPDGIMTIKVDELSECASLEIKSRMTQQTILSAKKAATKHGRTVFCAYMDEKFRDCVISANQVQILHQDFVTGLSYVVYVVSQVQEGSGQIVQIVIINIPDDFVREHKSIILKIAEPLLGWMYCDNVLADGYVKSELLPRWMTDRQKKIALSGC